jgi:hypothetical protein
MRPQTPSAEHQRIVFPLERDEDGFPPMDHESLWGKLASEDGAFRIDSIPFFATDVSLRDVVRAELVGDAWHFSEVLERAGHSTLRVMMLADGKLTVIRNALHQLGCQTELSHVPDFFSVDVPPDRALAPVIAYLKRMKTGRVLEHEEACMQHLPVG